MVGSPLVDVHGRPLTRRQQYAAAKVNRLTGGWLPANQDVNEVIRTSAPMLRARVRQLVRDFPYFARACNVLVDFTVGTGTNFQSRILNPTWRPGSTDRKFDRVTSQKIEDAVAWWADEADASGKLHFQELERLAKRQEVEAGEYLFVKTQIRDRRRYAPFALMAYEGDWLTSSHATPVGKNKIDQGIEYDTQTGCVAAYHFTDPWGGGKTQRIEAEHVLHGFDLHRPGQLRGVSPFVTAVLIAHDLNDYLDATIDTAKLAAKYLAIITTTDFEAWQRTRNVHGVGQDFGKKLEYLENAIIEYLRPGEDIKFAKNDTVGEMFGPYTKFVLQMVAIATGTSYTLLSGDYSQSSYTTLRGERQDLIKMFAPHQGRHIRHFTAPVIHEAITSAVLAGRLDLPDYFTNPRRYWRGLFIPPGMEPVDPLKESKANRDDMEATLRSPQEIAAKRGRDYEEILDELAEAKEMRAERGLADPDAGDTALANNPDKLGASESDERAFLRRCAPLIRRAAEEAAERTLLMMEDRYAEKGCPQ
jgi:lambda family phage portal protein